MDRDSRSRRYDDGEVTRYGAGESYRPFNDRTPRRARSPARERARSPPPRDRERARSPPLDSDRYVPDRTPRRRSRSADRYRRDRSRDRERDRDRDRDVHRDREGDRGDSWRRRDRTRSPRRSPLRRASPPRRNSPPRRYSPRRDGRDDRDRDRPRSPRLCYDSRSILPYDDSPRLVMPYRPRKTESLGNPNLIPIVLHNPNVIPLAEKSPSRKSLQNPNLIPLARKSPPHRSSHRAELNTLTRDSPPRRSLRNPNLIPLAGESPTSRSSSDSNLNHRAGESPSRRSRRNIHPSSWFNSRPRHPNGRSDNPNLIPVQSCHDLSVSSSYEWHKDKGSSGRTLSSYGHFGADDGDIVNPNSIPISNSPGSAFTDQGSRRVPSGRRNPHRTYNDFGIVPNPYTSPHKHQSSQTIGSRTRESNAKYRVRSRSPFDRREPRDRGDRGDRGDRERRSPPRRASPARGNTYRRRSPSLDRRDDRIGGSTYRRPSPPRESAVSSAIASRDTSRRSSPRPTSVRRDDRSIPQSPIPSRPLSRSSHGAARERSPVRASSDAVHLSARSPPRGPAALSRAPPTGPREARNFSGQSTTAIAPPSRPAPIPATASSRQDTPGAGVPPSGPRGYVASRGGYGRGGRGGSVGWGNPIQSRNLPASNGPASATTGTNSIPTGPRLTPTSTSVPSTPVAQSKSFNPPKGPAADLASKRPSFAEQLLATLPPIIPGGKIDPAQVPLHTGVLPELQVHYNQLREEEEKIRQEVAVKQEKLRKNLALWDKLERESKVLELRTNLSEQSLAKVSGDGVGGAAF